MPTKLQRLGIVSASALQRTAAAGARLRALQRELVALERNVETGEAPDPAETRGQLRIIYIGGRPACVSQIPAFKAEHPAAMIDIEQTGSRAIQRRIGMRPSGQTVLLCCWVCLHEP